MGMELKTDDLKLFLRKTCLGASEDIIMIMQLFAYLRLTKNINPLTAKLFNLNFHPLEVVSR